MWPNLLLNTHVTLFITECLCELIYYWMLTRPHLLLNEYRVYIVVNLLLYIFLNIVVHV
jgi:hypothetical protein